MTHSHFGDKVVIIGGGPAGLAAGLALHYQGFACTIIDSRVPPIDKACGEGLMPDALMSLARLGVQVHPVDGAVFGGIRFADGESSVQAMFPNGVGIGVRRTRLHQLMIEQARKLGIEMRWGSRAQLRENGVVTIDDEPISYHWLIGADGQSSTVRRWAGLDLVTKLNVRFGFRRHYRVVPWTDVVEVHWGACGQIYVTPVGHNEVCVALVTRDPKVRLDDVLPDFKELHQHLRGAPSSTSDRGAVTATRKLAQITRGSVALVGDASGSVDAVTGEGLAMSFRQALVLAECIKKGDLAPYQVAHEAINRLPGAMASLLLTMDRFPAVRRRALQVMEQSPQSFEKLLSVHVGHKSLAQFALSEAPALGWKLLTGQGAARS